MHRAVEGVAWRSSDPLVHVEAERELREARVEELELEPELEPEPRTRATNQSEKLEPEPEPERESRTRAIEPELESLRASELGMRWCSKPIVSV